MMNCSVGCEPQITNFTWVNGATISVCNLPLVPSWLLAVLLGVWFGCKYLSLGPTVLGSLSYGITYFMYAVMMTSGFLVHCIFLYDCTAASSSDYSPMFRLAGTVDLALTSCIAISFAFNGLIDLKWMRERSYCSWGVMLMTYGLVLFAYSSKCTSKFNLYFSSIVVGCGWYLVAQIILMIIRRPNVVEVTCFLAAGAVGGASLFLFRMRHCWLCTTLGPWSIEGIWYYGSDVSMLFLGLFIWKRRSSIEDGHEGVVCSNM